MNKPTMRTIESETVPKKKGLTLPLILGTISIVSLIWIGDHLAGGCIKADDVLRYCPIN